MRYKLLFLVALCVAAQFTHGAMAQTSFNATSNQATLAGNKLSYNIGDAIVISTNKCSELTVTQGYYQPNQGDSPLENAPVILNAKAYPNPTSSTVWIEVDVEHDAALEFQLIDATGKRVSATNANVQEGTHKQAIEMQQLSAGVYYLQLTASTAFGTANQSFKIQKN